MKVLFITTFYPPDTSVAAIRPYGLSSYLSMRGHDVTVLRLGKIFFKADMKKNTSIFNVRVLSAVDEMNVSIDSEDKAHVSSPLMRLLHRLYKFINYKLCDDITFTARYFYLSIVYFLHYKKIIDQLYKNNESFDIIISTFGGAENLLAGKYAQKKFDCKWIQDYRDPFPYGERVSKISNWIFSRIERKIQSLPNGITSISKGLLKKFTIPPYIPVKVIYNGYIPTKKEKKLCRHDSMLRFCYTGTIYYQFDDFRPLFRVIRKCIDEKFIDINLISIEYAGNFGSILKKQAKEYNLESIVYDYGYVTATEAEGIQNKSDIFLVARWNRRGEEGILSGKFFEGIRSQMPILSLVSGDLPNSELYELNQRYNYGFCYEEAQKNEHIKKLEEYVMLQYNRKINLLPAFYQPKKELFYNFSYDNLAREMEKFCFEIINSNN